MKYCRNSLSFILWISPEKYIFQKFQEGRQNTAFSLSKKTRFDFKKRKTVKKLSPDWRTAKRKHPSAIRERKIWSAGTKSSRKRTNSPRQHTDFQLQQQGELSTGIGQSCVTKLQIKRQNFWPKKQNFEKPTFEQPLPVSKNETFFLDDIPSEFKEDDVNFFWNVKLKLKF